MVLPENLRASVVPFSYLGLFLIKHCLAVVSRLHLPGGYGINLEVAALAAEPRMRWWRDAIAERIGEAPVLAGSGATWFTERAFTDDERDNALGDLVDEGARVVVTSTAAAPFAE